MKYRHHGLEFEIDDNWLIEACVTDFRPFQEIYKPFFSKNGCESVFPVRFEDVAPLKERAKQKGVFCDSSDTGETAKQRVMRILICLREGQPIEPVKVVRTHEAPYKFKLVEGCHRFHCALALGFSAVPAALGFDVAQLNP